MALEIHQQVMEGIKKSKNILITFKKNYTLDAVASAVALSIILKKMDKLCDIISSDFHMPETWKFLPTEKILPSISELRQLIVSLDISKSGLDQFSYNIEGNMLNVFISPKVGVFEEEDLSTSFSRYKYDSIITLDTPDLESLGRIYSNNVEFFAHTPIINIDHSPANENFGQINHADLTAVSTSEIIFELFKDEQESLIDDRVAQNLLAGMISETKSFKTSNITPKALSNAMRLIELGADRQQIVKNLYRSQSLATLRLWGRILSRLRTDETEKLVWAGISENDFSETQSSPENLLGITEEIISSLPKAEVAVFIYRIKGIVHCLVEVFRVHNALKLVKKYEPTGDKTLSQFTIPDITLLDAERDVIESIKKEIGPSDPLTNL